MVLLESHIRILREVAEKGEEGIPISEIVPKREYRDFVIGFLERQGLIRVRRQGGGGRAFITKKGLKVLRARARKKVVT